MHLHALLHFDHCLTIVFFSPSPKPYFPTSSSPTSRLLCYLLYLTRAAWRRWMIYLNKGNLPMTTPLRNMTSSQ